MRLKPILATRLMAFHTHRSKSKSRETHLEAEDAVEGDCVAPGRVGRDSRGPAGAFLHASTKSPQVPRPEEAVRLVCAAPRVRLMPLAEVPLLTDAVVPMRSTSTMGPV